jgi:hypothetical protein
MALSAFQDRGFGFPPSLPLSLQLRERILADFLEQTYEGLNLSRSARASAVIAVRFVTPSFW